MSAVCTIEGCDKPLTRRGYCNTHYHRWYRNGDPLAVKTATGRPKSTRECSIDGCSKPHYGNGWCLAHYTRDRRHDDPVAGGTAHGEPLEWLMKASEYEGDECLTWPYANGKDGHGRVYFEGRSQVASRVMCIVAHGPAPAPDLDAAHSCGNGHLACVTKRHLRWATRLENFEDMKLHGTHPSQRFADAAE